MKLIEKIFGSYSEHQIKKVMPLVNKIEALGDEIAALSDEELKCKTSEFKERLAKGETLDEILPEAFAVVREASTRVLNMRPFNVQLIGGIILHQGRIAEMKTGEGKTLVATLPTYLNALAGKGVHVITVNDYLAKRDSEWMGQIHTFLGLSVGVILHGLNQDERKEAYNCDVTYGTNNEFGFDYLKDNMVVYKEEKVQRGLNYCIVDEVDSVLIDEARTPLIISGAGEKSTEMYKVADFFVKTLTKGDYELDEKVKSVILTDLGIEKAESYFRLDNFADQENMSIQHHIVQALKANYSMKVDIDYMVKGDEVVIVDEFTGRMMEGRRYSDGLHQAIEAKEGVQVNKESKTLASITFQNLFRMYAKLAGMTGTAKTEEIEFREIYGLDVIEIPTNMPLRRDDKPDLVYRTVEAKYKAIVEEISEKHKAGIPVLVGTVSIEKSEILSNLLKKKGIPHQVLNAKYHEKEAEIISHAGEKGMVTIATNMAGRGTDIKLDPGVQELGGLMVMGTERHESRRIDLQLKGRSGRQGDLGESRFYISLEDDLMRIFGSERLQGLVGKLGLGDDAIESKMISNTIESAQKKVESNNFDTRKSVLQYDDVMNQQRTIIYNQRNQVLDGEDLTDQIKDMLKDVIKVAVNSHIVGEDDENYEEGFQKLLLYLEEIFLPKGMITIEELQNLSPDDIKEKLYEIGLELYEEKKKTLGDPDNIKEIERVILLKMVDTKWMEHIDNMDHLKQGIGLRAYRQQDPVQAYQFEGNDMFTEMIWSIKYDTIRYLFHISVAENVERERVATVTSVSHGDEDVKREPVRKDKKVGRNDECPCGSGKKYKNCCGRFK